LVRRGTVEVIGFVDDDPRRHGRSLLGVMIHPPQWLESVTWDFIAVADAGCTPLATAFDTSGRRVLLFPHGFDDDTLERMVSFWFPDPLASSLVRHAAPTGLRVGIFGTGAAGMKVWEAIAELEDADVVWFADNSPQRQGQSLLWVDVIPPADIPSRRHDAVVVGSMSREPILKQLVGLGVPPGRILLPDVTDSPDTVRAQLASALRRLARETISA
jgi:hypothetical protein